MTVDTNFIEVMWALMGFLGLTSQVWVLNDCRKDLDSWVVKFDEMTLITWFNIVACMGNGYVQLVFFGVGVRAILTPNPPSSGNGDVVSAVLGLLFIGCEIMLSAVSVGGMLLRRYLKSKADQFIAQQEAAKKLLEQAAAATAKWDGNPENDRRRFASSEYDG